MHYRLHFTLLVLILWLGLYTPQATALPDMAGRQIVLIAHTSNPQTKLYRRTLRGIYSMRMQTWPDASSLTVYVLADDSAVHKHFCREFLGVSPFNLRRNWDRLIFSGAGQAPVKVKTEAEMKQKVASTPGAIGYVTKEYIDDSIAIIQVQ